MQERSLGGLKTKDQKLLARLSAVLPDASDISGSDLLHVTGRASINAHKIETRQMCAGKNLPKTMTRPAPRSGTRLVRNWQGHCHTGDVGEDGFTLNGKV